MFKAIFLHQADNKTRAELVALDDSNLPAADTVVKISHSTINYKDALAITGRAPVVRKFPMVPGIDFAGTVESTSSDKLSAGDRVVLTGWGHGETEWGGLSERAAVKAERLIKLPDSLSNLDAMRIGTAGFTAMLCVEALSMAVKSGEEVLVTGANGGVGGFSVALLAARGFRVTASTGRQEESARLQKLGATNVISRSELSAPGKPLQKERWAGAVDSVGSHTLANVCASLSYGGAVAACGMAQGIDFPATVAPFILRGIKLLGIDSVFAPSEVRGHAWSQLAKELPANVLRDMVSEIGLSEVIPAAQRLLDGAVAGRLVVRMD